MKKTCSKITLMGFCLIAVALASSFIFSAKANAASSDPQMPAELQGREAKHHVFQVDDDTVDDWGGYIINNSNMLIMPGDTFEFPVHKGKDFYYSLGYWGDGDKQAYTVDYFNGASEDDFNFTGSVEVIGTQTITKKHGSTYKVPVKFKNNSGYPITVGLNMSGSAGEDGEDYLTRGLTIEFYQNYYPISFTGGYGDKDNLIECDYFWAKGEIGKLEFPSYYWVTDVPYTITVPNPVEEGSHFENWSGVSEGYYVDKGDVTEITICWDPDAKAVNNSGYSFQGYYLRESSPSFTNGSTITFDGNGGLVNGREKWVLEVSKDDTNESKPVYDFSLNTSTGDAKATKSGDTFLGWCSKEEALYNFYFGDDGEEKKLSSGNFVTKDSAEEAFEGLDLGDSKMSNNWGRGVLYAKWKSNTREKLEKNGWELDSNGVLWLLNSDGVRVWEKARESDTSLPAKVKNIRTDFKDKESVYIGGEGVFEDCTGLTELTFDNVCLNGYYLFKDCTNLKKITVTNDAWNWYSLLGTELFEGTSIDLVINVPDDQLEACKAYYPNYAYLFNADTSDKRYPLTVNGEIISDKNLSVKCGSGTATFDPKTSTLTLNNAELSTCLNLHNVTSGFWNGEYKEAYNGAVIVSNLSDLKIVLKGKNVVHREEDFVLKDLVRAYGNVEITGDGSVEGCLTSEHYFIENEPFKGICKLPITGLGDVTINGISATRLIVDSEGNLVIKNAKLTGGQYASKTSISISSTEIDQDNFSDGPERIMDTVIGSSGQSLSIDGCTLTYVTIDAGEWTKTFTIKDSKIKIDDKFDAAADTKLSITNSQIEAYGSDSGVTNINVKNITLKDCSITQGAWNKSGIFKIDDASSKPTPIPSGMPSPTPTAKPTTKPATPTPTAKPTTKPATPTPTAAPKSTWKQEGKKWYYYDAKGSKVTGWQEISKVWYFFDSNGVMQTGWIESGGKWYFMKDTGAMQTGWIQSGGKWYLLGSSGAMATGWIEEGGKWYYLSPSGAMATGWVKLGGKWYFLSASGAMATGWVQSGGKWYYMSPSGAMVENGWAKSGNSWYYFDANGVMVTGEYKTDGKMSKFSDSGAWIGYI